MNGAIAHNLGRGGAINLKNFGTLKTKQCVRIFKFWQTSDFAIFGHTWRLPHFERQISTTTHQTADSFRWNFLKHNELLKMSASWLDHNDKKLFWGQKWTSRCNLTYIFESFAESNKVNMFVIVWSKNWRLKWFFGRIPQVRYLYWLQKYQIYNFKHRHVCYHARLHLDYF